MPGRREFNHAQRLTIGVAHDKAGVQFLDRTRAALASAGKALLPFVDSAALLMCSIPLFAACHRRSTTISKPAVNALGLFERAEDQTFV